MQEENIYLEFILKNIDKTRNYFVGDIEKINWWVCMSLNYIDHFLVLVSESTACTSISDFNSLLATSIGLKSSAIGLNIWAITAGSEKYKPMI